MNTKFSYLYRDGANNKREGSIVLTGTPENGVAGFEEILRASLDDGEYFIPEQIKVPECFFWKQSVGGGQSGKVYPVAPGIDHAWHQFSAAELVECDATDPRTPGEFLAEVQTAARVGWKEDLVSEEENIRVLRELSGDPAFTAAELFKSEACGHRFAPEQICELHGLESFPEYNGERVKITAIRKNDDDGSRTYYIEGRINEVLNWVYEERLKEIAE